MLSDADFRKEFGKHIGIYPFKEENIEGGSIYLTASQYAWSRNAQKSILSSDGKTIAIDPHDTAIILTEESISLDMTVTGICLERVSFPTKALLSPSSPIKPGWTGRLLIALYNDSDDVVKIAVGDQIVVVMLFKLKKAATLGDEKGGGSRADLLLSLGIQISQEARKKLVERKYIDRNTLLEEMKKSDSFQYFIKRKKWDTSVAVISLLAVLAIIEAGFMIYLTVNQHSIQLLSMFFTATTSALVALYAKKVS